MPTSEKIRKLTGCKPVTDYFKSINANVYAAQQALQYAIVEEQIDIRKRETEQRIRDREEQRMLRIAQQQRERRHRSNNNDGQLQQDPLQLIRNAIDEGDYVEDIITTNLSEESTHKKRKWTRRPDNWIIIAEEARDFGDISAIRSYPGTFEGFSPDAVYQALKKWKKDLAQNNRNAGTLLGKKPVSGIIFDIELKKIVEDRMRLGKTYLLLIYYCCYYYCVLF